ncbi:hypothetical protein HHK36_007334 [Tetracentron sinense]|uniref:NAC domain-containing protein n=1 Tax=Tetracentron sinense TaxID=13715 RepID=A0A834ZKT9_TETSI|nr:hypothetical protein HHK36_007334 [Tetracentron sinense]
MMKYPIGYRFDPTDIELVDYYLKNRIHGLPLPHDTIMDYDVYGRDPSTLPRDFKYGKKDERYFFTQRPSGAHASRAAGGGFWKATNGVTNIKDDHGRTLGRKRSLTFHFGKTSDENTKTDWIMQEYLSADHNNITNLVLCKISESGYGTSKSKKAKVHHYEPSRDDQEANNIIRCPSTEPIGAEYQPAVQTLPMDASHLLTQTLSTDANPSNVEAASCNNVLVAAVHEILKLSEAEIASIFEELEQTLVPNESEWVLRKPLNVEKLREIGFVVYSIGKPLDQWLGYMPAVA